MKKEGFIAVVVAMAIVFTACGNASKEPEAPEVPEAVKTLQHKIDKALESEPTYDDLIEIQEEYDDLLMAEQEMITNYDKIVAMNTIDSKLVSCVFAANRLKERLKNPSSLEINSAYCYESDMTDYVKINYSASNDLGGMKDGEYYCMTTIPTEKDGVWQCAYDSYYKVDLALDSMMGSDNAQSTGKIEFLRYESNATEMTPKQIMDNIDLKIRLVDN
jgi:hypothetical protein